MTTGNPTIDVIIWVIGFLGFGGICGTVISRAVTNKMEDDKKERAALEAARIEEMMTLHEGLTSVGHVARAAADEIVRQHGPCAKIETAIQYHDRFREKEDAQLRQRAAERVHGNA